SAEWREQHIQSQQESGKGSVSVKEIFAPGLSRVTILASLVATAAFIAYYGASTWLPSYLEAERGLDPQTVGQFMTWLNLGMFAGYIVFGWLADKIGKKNALLLSMFGSGVLMPLYGVVTDQSILLWLGPAYAFFMTFAGLFGSYLGELYPTRVRAAGAGFTFNVGRGISAFAPMILGGVAAAASFAAGLVVAGAIFLVGGVFLLFLPQAPSDRKPAKSTVTPEGVQPMRNIVDISVSLKAGIKSDPPGHEPQIEYLNHKDTARDILSFFPGATIDDLPDQEGWAIERINASTHTGT